MNDSNLKHFLHELQLLVNAESIPCIGGRSELPTQPGLQVKGRPISLPVAQDDLEWLCKQGCQSPFGKGYDTVLDTDVRRSIEFEAQDIEISNPSWGSALEKLSQIIAEQMEIDFQIKAELFKLLVYREGGHFKFHQDTEKTQGMFATLIVQLPSRHKGGALVCRFADKEYRFDFGNKEGDAEFNIYFAAHYADVHHQVETIEKGARLALVYNLIQPSSERLLSANHHQQLFDSTQKMIAPILSSLSQTQHALLLQHEYTEQSLSELGFSASKGQDRELIQALLAINESLPLEHKLYFMICRFSYSVTSEGYGHDYGYDDEYDEDDIDDGDWEEIESTDPSFDLCFDQEGQRIPINDFSIDRVHDLSDQEINSIDLDKIDEDFWGEGDHDIEGFMGNYGPSKETTYARYLLAVMPAYPTDTEAVPKDMVVQVHLLLSMAYDLHLQPNLDWLQTRYDITLKQILAQLAPFVQQNQNSHHWDHYFGDKSLAVFTCLVKTAITTSDDNLCQTAIDAVSTHIKANLSSQDHATDVLNVLKGAIETFGWNALANILTPILNELDGNAALSTASSLAQNNLDSNMRAKLMGACINAICREQDCWGQDSQFKTVVLPLAVKLCKIDWCVSIDAKNQFLAACLDKGEEQPSFLSALIKNLIKDTQADDKNALLKPLISARLLYLENELIKEAPAESWAMPKANVQNRDLRAFLTSENQQTQIFGYDGIAMARQDVVHLETKNILPEFHMEANADFQQPEKNYGFSATMQAKGRGKQAYVEVIKDQRYYDLSIQLRKRHKQEFERLKDYQL